MKNDIRPVVIYNVEKKEVIGIFSMTSLVIKYLFDKITNADKGKVYNALRNKSKIAKTVFDFKIAIRYANKAQIERLYDKDYVIMADYPIPHYTRMQGFVDNKESLQRGWNERTNRRVAELKIQK